MHYLPSIIWILAVLILSLIPGNSFKKVEVFDFFDKIVHFGFYFIMSALIVFDYIRKNKIVNNNRDIVILSVIDLSISLVIGAVIEILQFCCVVNRTGSLGDFIANLTGSVIGIIAGLYFFIRIKKPIS